MTRSGPVQLAEDVYWVGTRLADDRFQCHPYLIDNGTDSVLIDPGSPLTIEATLRSIGEVTDVANVRWMVAHHPDPDVVAALPRLSQIISRPDARVVTEWRAAALLRHYGHRFAYYLVEENDWRIDLGAGRRLEFQLTPYLHFPGAMVSFDSRTRTLFSSDLFGGFVPDSAVLVSSDIEYIVEAARPFHQHYLPSRELLEAGLTRVEHRWPRIDRIAPQHGHVIDTPAVTAAFEALKGLDCGIFALADADLDLQRLLRIAEARTQITNALLVATEPATLLSELNHILRAAEAPLEAALFVDLPDHGWTMWASGAAHSVRSEPPPAWPSITLAGNPAALLALRVPEGGVVDPDLLDMLEGMAAAVRPAVDQYLHDRRQSRRVADLRHAALTDPLTGLRNRRALDEAAPTGSYAVIALDLDHFKRVNDDFGHASGDTVLSHFGAILAGAVRDEDRAYRIGGEEFVVVLPDTDATAALVVAERIGASVRGLDLTGHAPDGHVTVSMGVTACSAATPARFEEILDVADHALYRAKQAGRDRAHFLEFALPGN